MKSLSIPGLFFRLFRTHKFLSASVVSAIVFLVPINQVGAAENRIPVLAGPVSDMFFPDLNFQLQAGVNYSYFFNNHEYESGAFILPSWEELNDWQLSTNGQLPLAMVDKEDLERIPTLNFQARRQLSEAMDFLLRYRLSYLNAMSSEDEHVAGFSRGNSHRWQQYSAEANMKWSLVQAKIGLSLEKNDMGNDAFSPTRQSWVAAVTLTPLDDLDLHLGFNYQNNNFSRTEIDEEREENRASAVLRLSYMLSDDMYLSTEYQHTDSKSDDPQYDFQRDTLLLNVSMGF